MAQFLMQMAGWMGTGKSSLASAVASTVSAVILDHDTTKSALLAAGVPHPPAGAASYEVVFSLARDLLAQGHAVIIDSPSLYSSIPERGLSLATEAGVRYFFVECVCDEAVTEQRLLTRTGRRSQVASAAQASAVRGDPGRVPHRPEKGARSVDTSRPIGECVERVMEYIAGTGAEGKAVT